MKIAFIGAAGNIATAVISGILKSKYEKEQNLYLFDINRERLSAYPEAMICESAAEAVSQADYVFLTVKPQVIFSVIDEIKLSLTADKKIVSVAAGISIDAIKKAVGFDCKVIRVMPNTPLLLAQGASGLAYKTPVSENEFDYVLGIFRTAGIAVSCDEEQINAVTAVSGSGPAYVFKFAKAIIDEATSLGLDEDKAALLMYQTLIGSAYMLRDSNMTPAELIKMVTSPKGTTLAALESFDRDDFDNTVKRAVKACHDRALELGKSE